MRPYLPLFAAAYRFGRGTRKSDRTVWLDSGIVGLAALPLVWQFVVKPRRLAESDDAWLHAADMALYEAKRRGRNQTVVG